MSDRLCPLCGDHPADVQTIAAGIPLVRCPTAPGVPYRRDTSPPPPAP